MDLTKASKIAARAASIQAELGLSGRLLLFSWPTNNNSWSYRGDLRNLSRVHDPLMRVVTQMQETVSAENITLIGHSLGAKGMVEALIRMRPPDGSQQRIDKLILLAPDIAREEFLMQSDALQRRVGKIVVFESSRDRALKLSRWFTERQDWARVDFKLPAIYMLSVTVLFTMILPPSLT